MLITTSIVTLTLTLPIPTQDTKIAEDCKGFVIILKDANDNTVDVLCVQKPSCPLGTEIDSLNYGVGGEWVSCKPCSHGEYCIRELPM